SPEPTSGPAAGVQLSWSDPGAWQSGSVPGPRDVAVIDGNMLLDTDAAVAGVEVRPGGHLTFAPEHSVLLESSGNVIVHGNLTIVPDGPEIEHVLRFIDIDESAVVGGGMDPVATDVGLWVVDGGVLHAEGQQRRGWNRTGTDPTWRVGDEVFVAPMAVGDFAGFAPFTPGSSVPVAKGVGEAIAAEVFNVTRNVRIEGTESGRAHVMFSHCTNPQTVRFVAIRHVAPIPQGGADVSQGLQHSTGRYGLHFHHCRDGTRGTVVEGVVVRDCGGHAFVPHASHGITLRDCVAYTVAADAYWWDPESSPDSYPSNATHDLVYDHCAAFDLAPTGDHRGFELTGFHLGQGEGNRCVDCTAAGVRGRVNSSGFHWPSKANGMPNVWDFRDCVAHNNTRHGVFIWQNDSADHRLERFRGFRNGGSGVNHGAYLNRYEFEDLALFDNDRCVTSHAGGRGGQPTRYRGLRATDSLFIAGHPIPFNGPARFVDCEFPSPIVVNAAIGGRPSSGGDYEFIDCRADGRPLAASDFEFVVAPVDTRIHVQNGSEAFEVDGDGSSRPADPIED
ncbi:MAG: hypothetical protein R3246_10670, partial [Acidimicrobiia bacterium]|nr:hypothetical protein [Acidimicrobiia bacterium]